MEFSKAMAVFIADWRKEAGACNGSAECLDTAFLDSRVELESDKVNDMVSSVFFLANRL